MFKKKNDGAEFCQKFLESIIEPAITCESECLLFGVPHGYKGELSGRKDIEENNRTRKVTQDELKDAGDEYGERVGITVKVPDLLIPENPAVPVFFKIKGEWQETAMGVPWQFFHLLIKYIWKQTEYDPIKGIGYKKDEVTSFSYPCIQNNLPIEINSINCIFSMNKHGQYMITFESKDSDKTMD